MERSSYFIKNRALFGSYPTQQEIEELEKEGVRFFVDLTFKDERKIVPYNTKYRYISFPIIDRQIPDNNIKFACFIQCLTSIIRNLKNGELFYLHCKGGHGRSGVVVAVLLCYMFGLSPEQALEHTTRYHSRRIVMRDKWRKLGSPQTFPQKNFVYFFCKPVNFYRAYKTGFTAGFSTFSPHPVTIDDLGTFLTCEAAIQAYKDPSNNEFIKKLQETVNPINAKNLGKKIIVENWDELAPNLMLRILKFKFDQHPEIKKTLLSTRLCPLIQHTRGDNFWGDGGDGSGMNYLGKQLMKLRESYYNDIEFTF
jgi:ribA/ribD-fused uncharacterized protein